MSDVIGRRAHALRKLDVIVALGYDPATLIAPTPAPVDVAATGGVLIRPLADVVRDALFGPSDFSATPGTTQFQAANTARTAAGGGPITVRPGTYTLAGNVYSDLVNLWTFQAGAKLAGAGAIDAVADGAVLGQSGLTFARLLGGAGASHVMSIQGRAAALTAPATSTESTGLLISLVNNRPSDYSPGAPRLHDIANLELQQIGQGSTTLRMHGLSVGIGPGAGADGYVSAIEGTSINNSGITSGTLGAINSKLAFHAVAFGNAPSTVGFCTSGGDATLMPNGLFLDAFLAVQESMPVGGHAFSVRPLSTIASPKTRADDVAWIGRDGSASFTDLGINNAVQFAASVGTKINLFGTAYGFGIYGGEMALYSGGSWAFRAGGYAGAVVASITSNGSARFTGLALTTVALTSGTTVATDCAVANVFTLTLATNATLATPTNMAVGGSYAWRITQDGTGSRTLAYGSAFKWAGGVAPTLSTAPGAVDVLTAVSFDGTTLNAALNAAFA